MNKTAIKNFAIWARNKLTTDIESNAYLIGITKEGIQDPLPQSTRDVQYFDVGSGTPYALDKTGIGKRDKLVKSLSDEAKDVGYDIAYNNLIEHTASTWFNRLCAIRFMEVNDYFSDGLRVLSSVDEGRKDSDLMVSPFESNLEFSEQEQADIKSWKLENNNEKLFVFLLQKKCAALSEILPGLFVKEDEPISLLVHFSIADAEGIVHSLVNDIEEEDWKEQVQIIGWLYQFYNTEFKDETNALLKKKGEVLTKDRIPAVTQLFTPEWIVKYMVENSLGRIWIDGHPDSKGRFLSTEEEQTAYAAGERYGNDHKWHYYLEEAKQEAKVEAELQKIRAEYAQLRPEDLSFADVCMGSGHILCYAFDVLMQIYESLGYTARDAVRSIIENNLYGLDIDERAYQLAYFSVMMKARQYDRGAFRRGYAPKVYAFEESNGITERQLSIFGVDLNDMERNLATEQMKALVETFHDAKEYGSILKVEPMNWDLLRCYISSFDVYGKLDLMEMEVSALVKRLDSLINIGEILSKKYWVTCTNPPYMAPTIKQRVITDTEYEDSKYDLCTVFIERLKDLTAINGLQAMITMHSWMFIGSYEQFRNSFNKLSLINMAHMGTRSFDEIGGDVVQTTSFVVMNRYLSDRKSLFLRLVGGNSEEEKRQLFITHKNRFWTNQSYFSLIPGSPIAYWLSDKVFSCLKNRKALGERYTFREGIHTSDNARFLRLWYEVNVNTIVYTASCYEDIDANGKYVPYNKGGAYRKWYGNNDYVIPFNEQSREEMSKLKGHVRPSQNLYFKKGGTWSSVSQSGFGVRFFPDGFLFDAGGQVVVGKRVELCIAFLNSSLFKLIAEATMPTINYKCGIITNLPDLIIENERIDSLCKQNIDLSKSDWDSFETSWGFQRHPLVSVISRNRMLFDDISNIDLAECYMCWENECNERFDQLKANEEELNRIFIDIYGLQGELTPKVADEDVTVRKADLMRDVKSLISYAVGCMLGRYSLDMEGLAFAGGGWKQAFVNNYRMFIPDDDNCIPITDENYFSDDIVGRFVEFIRIVYGENSLETNLQFIADAIGGKGDDAREVIRKYFLNDFFKDHCKTYSVTGSGKRPIYWLFDSGKQNGFKALVYMHRWTGDTIATVRARYVSKVQEKYENELRAMDLQMEHMPDPRQKAALQKRKEKILKQVAEIKQYDELIGHLALEHIDIDLDDGVKVNHEKVQHDRNGDKYQILAPIK